MKPKLGQTTENYNYFIKTDTSEYSGEWIAIANKQVIAHGKSAEMVYQKALKKFSNEEISLAKIPEDEVLVY
jgi:ABC-type enterochelin transport system ATPase subunit